MKERVSYSSKDSITVKRSKAPDRSYEATEARVSKYMEKFQESLKASSELLQRAKMIQTPAGRKIMFKEGTKDE
ncbi:hypothetical protein BSP36_061 [Bacillus phage BSP36]|uniref:Uncharacterized protein n=1 Tax=Bacillus phage BSP38 TaxID=2283013 RepID=A0A345MJS2_BPBSP|nr:hypothetical protein HWB82_gp062 [Bacillus phage BSP38]AXH71104.1 hypothetical protein BSP38_062 [Bacillus phage BSP38]AYJ75148.1 hypothetical protein BSP36_061 [Bacillus phage BSP36]